MKRIFQYTPILIFLIQTSLCFSEVREYFKLDASILLIVVVVVILLYILNYIATFSTPYKKFKDFEATKELLLENYVDDFSKSMESLNIPFRINVMTVNRKFISVIEPGLIFGRRIRFFSKLLKMYWISKAMDHSSDRNMTLSVRQGVAGICISNGSPVMVFFDDEDQESYNLNKRQLTKAKELLFVYSFPIRQINKKNRRVGDKIIGVINIDSTSEKAFRIRENEDFVKSLTNKAESLSQLCSIVI